jgi:hypothetical protein
MPLIGQDSYSFVDRQCGKIIGSSRYCAYNPPPLK